MFTMVCSSWTLSHTHSAAGVALNPPLLAGFTPQSLGCLAHVWEMLTEFSLLDKAGLPVLLPVGVCSKWADIALLIVLCCLVHTMCWDDMRDEMGCSSTLLSADFMYTVNLLLSLPS